MRHRIHLAMKALTLSLLIARTTLAVEPPPSPDNAATIGIATFHAIGDLPGGPFASQARGISADGTTVVGGSKSVDSVTGGFHRAIRWTVQGGMTALGHLGSPQSHGFARAASADGSVIMGSSGNSFIWTQVQGMITLGDDCGAVDVSHNGTIITGWCQSIVGRDAALWTEAGGWQQFGALGVDPVDAFFCGISLDHQVLGGQSMLDDPPNAVEPIRWTARDGMQGLGDVAGGSHYAVALALAADGQSMVGFAIGDVGVDAFRWTSAGGLQNLETQTPGVTTSQANAVSGDGSIIVGGADFVEGFGFIWDEDHGMRSLQKMLRDRFGLPLPGWILQSVNDISDDGLVMVGSGTNPLGKPEGWRVRIPFMPRDGDTNADLIVNIDDLVQVITGWGPCPTPPSPCPGDLTANGAVNIDDLVMVIINWGGI